MMAGLLKDQTMTNLTETARLFANAFESRTRDNGDAFLALKDGSPDWMTDALYNAHGGILPDDHCYRMASEVSDAFAETLEYDADADLDYWRHECIDAMVSVYDADRFAWLASNLARAEYCDEARGEGMVSDDASLSDRIAAGWYREAESIFEAIRAAIEENADDE